MMEYKKIFLICVFSILIGLTISPIVSGAKTITDLNTNTPLPLGEILTITGNYNNTDSNASVFCKFLTKNNNIIVERLTDERTFPNGDFYSQRKLEEPKYKRGNTYSVSVTCETTSADTNFTVGQRASIEHIAQQETLAIFQKGNMDALMQVGTVILLIILFIIFLVFFVKAGKRLSG